MYSEEITQTSLSTIGVMISGAQLFNDYEDQSREFKTEPTKVRPVGQHEVAVLLI